MDLFTLVQSKNLKSIRKFEQLHDGTFIDAMHHTTPTPVHVEGLGVVTNTNILQFTIAQLVQLKNKGRRKKKDYEILNSILDIFIKLADIAMLNHMDSMGNNCLHYASLLGERDVLVSVIDEKVKVVRNSEGKTAYALCADRECREVVKEYAGECIDFYCGSENKQEKGFKNNFGENFQNNNEDSGKEDSILKTTKKFVKGTNVNEDTKYAPKYLKNDEKKEHKNDLPLQKKQGGRFFVHIERVVGLLSSRPLESVFFVIETPSRIITTKQHPPEMDIYPDELFSFEISSPSSFSLKVFAVTQGFSRKTDRVSCVCSITTPILECEIKEITLKTKAIKHTTSPSIFRQFYSYVVREKLTLRSIQTNISYVPYEIIDQDTRMPESYLEMQLLEKMQRIGTRQWFRGCVNVRRNSDLLWKNRVVSWCGMYLRVKNDCSGKVQSEWNMGKMVDFCTSYEKGWKRYLKMEFGNERLEMSFNNGDAFDEFMRAVRWFREV